jgi:hypothetical protein
MKKVAYILTLFYVCLSLDAQLPSSFSWKSRHSYGYLPDYSKNQLIQGPCGVFAAVAAVEAMCQIYYNNPGKDLFDFSEAYVYNSSENDCPGIGCESANASSVLDFASTTGLINDNAFTFTLSKIEDNCILDCGSLGTPSQRIFVPYMNNSWQITPSSIDTEDELKQAILDFGPIVMQPGPSDYNACALNPNDNECTNRKHTVLLTGWSGSYWEIWDSWPGAPSFGYKTYDVFYYHPTFYRVYPVNPANSSDVLRCNGSQSELFSRKGWDKDGDGFYSWGLEYYGRPSGCPGPNLMDWNDGDGTQIFRSGTTVYATPTVSGTSGNVCMSGSQFSLNYVPDGFTCTWYISKNANCFNTYQGNGSSVTLYPNSTCTGKESEITFRITQNGDGGYAEYKQSFYVNCPHEDLMSYYVLDSYGSAPPKYGETYYLCPYTYYTIYFNENDGSCNVTGLEWNLPYAWSKNYEESNYVSIYTNDVPDGFMEIKGYTSCSPSAKAVLLSPYFAPFECGGYFLAYPNPSENFVDIDIDKSKVSAEKITIGDECLLTLVDKTGLIKFKTTFKGFPYRIDTTQLPEGMYFVNIVFKGRTSTIRLVIRHR